METIQKLTWRQLIEELKNITEDQLDEPVLATGDERGESFSCIYKPEEDLRQTEEGWEPSSCVKDYYKDEIPEGELFDEEDFEEQHPIVFKKGWLALELN